AEKGASWGRSGSLNGKLRCTGPGGPPAARANAWRASARAWAISSGVFSGTGTSAYHLTWSPKILSWSMVWGEPMPRASGGRSAVSTMRGTCPTYASTTLGRKLAAAVPEVHRTATGRRAALAAHKAKTPAERSSMWLKRRTPGCSAKRRARGVEREPGAKQTSFNPARTSSSTKAAVGAYWDPSFISAKIGRASCRERGEIRAVVVAAVEAKN